MEVWSFKELLVYGDEILGDVGLGRKNMTPTMKGCMSSPGTNPPDFEWSIELDITIEN